MNPWAAAVIAARPADGAAAIRHLANLGDRVMFSSSPVDYGEVTHVNVQPPEHWSALFAHADLRVPSVLEDGVARFLLDLAMAHAAQTRAVD